VAGLSPDDAKAYAAHSVTVRSLQAALDEGRGMPASLAQARRVTTLGDVPLIVLSRGLPEGDEPQWQREQTELLQLSSESHQVFADQSHHNVQFDQPAAAIGAIVTMVERVRRQTTAVVGVPGSGGGELPWTEDTSGPATRIRAGS
jgi:hypothetical protein